MLLLIRANMHVQLEPQILTWVRIYNPSSEMLARLCLAAYSYVQTFHALDRWLIYSKTYILGKRLNLWFYKGTMGHILRSVIA